MNKIVAIQTPHYAPNYGAQLQAFALGRAIKELGYDIEYINRRPSYFYEHSNVIDRFFKSLELKTRMKGFIEFEKLYLQPQSKLLIHNKDYSTLDVSKYKAIVVGSDQIWRDDYFYHSFEYSPYLFFFKSGATKKISYAASFGKNTCNPPEERRQRIEELLKDFNAISLREKSGVDILKETYNADGVWVADPTLLHNKEYYVKTLNLTESANPIIVTYILGASSAAMQKLNGISKKMHLPLDHIYKKSNKWWMYKRPFSTLAKYKSVPSVFEWLNKILSAEYVITDSFHGMCFSIIFHKQFIVINNKAGGSERFLSLLSKLGLTDRLLEWTASDKQIMTKLEEQIDYESVDTQKLQFTGHSISFLKDAIKK